MEEVTSMQEFQRSETINSSADQVFEFLSDIKNFPKYLPTVQNAQFEGGDRIRFQGEAGGQKYDDTGFYRADKQNRRMEWSSDGESNYHGWLEVSEGNNNSCGVTVHLAFDTKSQALQEMDKGTGDHEQAINAGIEKTLQSIKDQCEGRGGSKEAASKK
jgi:uncharacterized membrane protein